jgi:phospholipid/cholesterol/gamma-HCH transport system substrate-binding protein
MQPSATRDLVVGVFVAAGLAAIAYLSLQVGGLSYAGPGGFELVAVFDEVGGLRTRAPVAIAGVTVGRVEKIELDDSLRAKVTLDLDPKLQLDVDTTAAVRTSGVLGDQFIALEPSGGEELLQSGDEITYTESALSLERLIGKFVQNSGIDDESK